jgi:hypothetical protein
MSRIQFDAARGEHLISIARTHDRATAAQNQRSARQRGSRLGAAAGTMVQRLRHATAVNRVGKPYAFAPPQYLSSLITAINDGARTAHTGVFVFAGRALPASHRLQPHRVRTFKRSRDVRFTEKVVDFFCAFDALTVDQTGGGAGRGPGTSPFARAVRWLLAFLSQTEWAVHLGKPVGLAFALPGSPGVEQE